MTFNLSPGEVKPMGEIVIDGGDGGESLRGQPLRWYTWELLCGTLPEADVCATAPALLVYTKAENVPVYLESLRRVKALLAKPDLIVALVVDGAPDCEDASLPMVAGTPANGATTLVVDRTGTVILESSNIPPVQFLRAL